MIYRNVELHNIDEVTQVGDGRAVRLQRAPEALRLKLNKNAQEKVLSPANAEIRFVCEGPSVRLTLSSEGQTDATVFNGLFQGKRPLVIGAEPQVVELPARADRLARMPEEYGKAMAFSPNVCRIMLRGAPLRIHEIEGDVRPPVAGEVPALRYLAYGTSITHGSAATGPHLTYVAQVARRLNADLINLGLGGAAHCEFELSDYIAACPHPNVHLIEGTDILQEVGGLTTDLLHPSDNGMIQMGENLARKLAPLVSPD